LVWQKQDRGPSSFRLKLIRRSQVRHKPRAKKLYTSFIHKNYIYKPFFSLSTLSLHNRWGFCQFNVAIKSNNIIYIYIYLFSKKAVHTTSTTFGATLLSKVCTLLEEDSIFNFTQHLPLILLFSPKQQWWKHWKGIPRLHHFRVVFKWTGKESVHVNRRVKLFKSDSFPFDSNRVYLHFANNFALINVP
jgi:hypothetical protein